MTDAPLGFNRSAFALGLRAAALFVAIAVIILQITEHPLRPGQERLILFTRGGVVAVSLVLSALSSPRRPATVLQLLGYLLILTLTVSSGVVLKVEPQTVWQASSRLVAIIFGAAVFATWSWRWQLAAALTITLGLLAAVLLWVPRAVFPPGDVARLALGFTVFAAASVYGAHQAQQERRRVAASEARYRGLFEAAGDAIAVLDQSGRIHEANPRLGEMLGRPLSEVVGRTLSEFTLAPARGEDPITPDLRHAAQILRHADGHPVEVEITFARTTAADDRPQFVQAILRDLTERHALQRREIQEQQLDALGRMAGGIAHQFNNLLGGILTHAAVLREDAVNRASATELDEVLAAARRGRDLTKELLRFTKHDVITLTPTSPTALLESVAALARASLPQDVAIEINAPADLPAMAGDVDHLVHACLQLVLNARDALAGRSGRRLTITAAAQHVTAADPRWPDAKPGAYVRISIADNGRGMDPGTRDRAFEPFFSTKPLHQAAGLGLATVRGVVRDHRGAVGVESTPGRGTVVHLLIPVSAQQAAAPAPGKAGTGAAAAAGAAAPAAAPQRTVLIVDDEEIVRHSLRRALTRFGYRVVEAQDGGTALAQVQGSDPPVDLVILDLVLPGGGAGIFEILKSIRPDLKVLVSSGYSPDSDNVKALVTKVQGFLPKPYEIGELRDAVARALAAPPSPPA